MATAGGHTFLHGTAAEFVQAFVQNGRLDPLVARNNMMWESEPGFYLATHWRTAVYVGALRNNGTYAAQVDMTNVVYTSLISAGAEQRQILQGRALNPFEGEELFVPISAFGLFNDHVDTGDITFDYFVYPDEE